jgi:hypothetical protein
MFATEHDPLALLIEITPKSAKRRFREEIYKAWDHSCGYCGAPATSLDHIVPRFRSGSSNSNNLLPSCQRCNSNKGSIKMETWYVTQAFYCESRMAKIQQWINREVLDIFQYTDNHAMTLKEAI